VALPICGASAVSVSHIIRSVGSLVVDTFDLHREGSAANLVPNPGLETAGPTGWESNAWGTNTAAFSYPVPGQCP